MGDMISIALGAIEAGLIAAALGLAFGLLAVAFE